MNLAIVGGGELAQAVDTAVQDQYTVTTFGREHTDLVQKSQCDQLATQLMTFDNILFTAGAYNTDLWDMWAVNTVAPCYLVSQLVNNNYTGHVIVVSSHAANWTSWHGIDVNRLTYNNSKHAVSNFVKGVQQSNVVGRYSLLEPGRFQSRMGGDSGHTLQTVVDAVKFLLTHPARSITV
jgi:NAD(P)-dependent dehydrogenase (short-subunit alcohol dehydrogenase family)